MILKKLKLLLIDDHPLFRKGMISILQNSDIIEKIFEADNLERAYKIIEEENIDIVTLDLNLPGEDGIKFLNKYVERKFKVLVITTYNSKFLLQEVLKRGADGYIKKENLYDNLLESIECVINDGTYTDDNHCDKENLTIDEKAGRYFFLTNAEKEVFKLLAVGKNPKEIATILSKSYKTVENQKNSIMTKMEIRSDMELFKVAFRLNLTDL